MSRKELLTRIEFQLKEIWRAQERQNGSWIELAQIEALLLIARTNLESDLPR